MLMLGVLVASAALAQDRPPVAVDLPAQPLGRSLVDLAEQTGTTIVAPDALVAGKSAPALSGTFAPEDAVRRLIARSGLSARTGAEGAIIVSAGPEGGSDGGPARLEPITVDAVLEGTLTDSYAAPDNFAATRTDTPAIDTPQSTQAVTRQALEDARVTDVADSYQYLAGINRDSNIGGIFGDQYLARGFVTENILINGNRSGRPSTLDTANVERIEAIRGPTATLFGRADPGGLVNIVTKQPLAEPFYQAELDGGTGFFGDGARYRDVRGTLDTGGPIDDEGRVRYRLNAAAEYEQSFRQDVDNTLFFVSPVVDVNLDPKTIVNAEFTYQYRDFVFDRGIPFINGEPRLPVDWYIGEEQAPDISSNYLAGTFRVDRKMTDALTARLGIYTSYNRVDGDGIQQANVIGAQASAQRANFDVSNLVVTVQPELVADFATGPVGHTVLLGVDASYRRDKIDAIFGPAGTPFDLFDPNFPVDAPAINISQPGTLGSFSTFKARELGLYAEDQIDLSEQWKMLLGLRWDAVWLKSDFEGTFPPLVFTDEGEFKDNEFLPRVGLVYQPIKQIGLYASYSETYRPPPGAINSQADGEQIKPEQGRSYEAGVKLDALGGKLTGTLAAYWTDKENVIETDPENPFAVINLGEVRSQGVELDLAGEVFENFSLGLSYAFTDARIRSSADANLTKGTRIRNVPRHAGSLQAAYRFTEGDLRGLRVFGGVVYESRKQTLTSASVNIPVPSYVRFDLGASYEVTENVQARLFFQNLGNTEYYTSAGSQNLVYAGQPFNATLGVRVRF